MLIRIPPISGGGVPIGELALIMYLLAIDHTKLLTLFGSIVLVYPFILWWIIGLTQALIGTYEHGMWALRDASHVIESLYIIVGFAFADIPKNIVRLYNSLFKFFLLLVGYSFTYPFRDILQTYSPTIQAASDRVVPIALNYLTTPSLLLLTIAFFIITKRDAVYFSIPVYVYSFILLIYTVALFQARTIYLQLIFLGTFFFIYEKRVTEIWIVYLILILLVLAALPILNIEITGRLGQRASLDFLIRHFYSIFGNKSEGVVGAAAGIGLRLTWWLNLYEQWTSDITSFLFGLGYGFPLVDFKAYGVQIREPHNSLISLIARTGLVGAVSFVWMHVWLLKVWKSSYVYCLHIKWNHGQYILLTIMVFFILIWVDSIGEDTFEKPFNAIPYYFLWGVVLRMARHLKDGTIVQGGLVPSESG